MSKKLILAISSRALFDLDKSHEVYEQKGVEAYFQYQVERENEPLSPGVAYTLIKKLISLKHPATQEPFVEVILLSRNSVDTGLRVFNSIQHENLPITRAVFTNGSTPYPYISAFGAHLFLSTHGEDVRQALAAGCAGATLLSGIKNTADEHEIRIAFDGDAVLFSDEAERVFQEEGLNAFKERELKLAKEPLPPGPFKGFLEALHGIQKEFPLGQCPIRTALVTARDAPTHERVIHTLRSWKIHIDEGFFLGGLPKRDFLKAFGADIFFDDQKNHCDLAREEVMTGHVPHGVVNES